MTVIDADGHVTESAEQVVKYMDAPFRHRQLVFPIVPADGWDRRLITKFHDTAATADAWLRALDKGGMEQAVLFPTLGLFMSFIKDRTWAVQFCRAYNTLMHEEFITASRRPPADPGPRGCGGGARARGPRARPRRRDAGGRRQPRPGRRVLHADLRRGPAARRDARRPRLGLASGRRRRGLLPAVHPGAHLLPPLRPDAPAHVDRLRGDPRALRRPPPGLPRGGRGVGAVLDGADGRRIRQARRGRGARAQAEAQRLRAVGEDLLLVRGRRMAPAPGPQVGR